MAARVVMEFDRLVPATLRAVLDCLLACDLDWHQQNPDAPIIYDTGTRYQREPQGSERFVQSGLLRSKKEGDCEDLACDLCAWLNVRGIPATVTFTWRTRPNGSRLYHILVQHPDGRIEDPSLKLGMGGPGDRPALA